MTDTRIVYGYKCAWWDTIDKVGSTRLEHVGISLPCCPHCGGLLFEMPTPEDWWKAVEGYESRGHPGYRACVEWMQGRCFPNPQRAIEAYEAETGIRINLDE